MMYNPDIANTFQYNWSEAIRSAKRLRTSLLRLAKTFPLSGERLKAPSDELLEKLDAFRVRYCDLQDCIGNKLFRGILLLEEENPASMLDTLNRMEKRSLISSIEQWRSWRMVRNAFAHDSHNYPDSEQKRADALNAAWQASPGLIRILEKIKSYLNEELSLDSGGIDFETL